jgi:hypothetical protein
MPKALPNGRERGINWSAPLNGALFFYLNGCSCVDATLADQLALTPRWGMQNT